MNIEQLAAKIEKLGINMGRFDAILNGPEEGSGSQVVTDSGLVRTVARVLAEVQAGAKGDDGREVEFRSTATHLQWRHVGEESWANLISVAALKGAAGNDGREVELLTTETHIQWRYAGDSTWINLVSRESLRGEPGRDGVDGFGATVQVVQNPPSNPEDGVVYLIPGSPTGGGGGDATDLTYDPFTRTLESSTGQGVTLPIAVPDRPDVPGQEVGVAGLISSQDQGKIEGLYPSLSDYTFFTSDPLPRGSRWRIDNESQNVGNLPPGNPYGILSVEGRSRWRLRYTYYTLQDTGQCVEYYAWRNGNGWSGWDRNLTLNSPALLLTAIRNAAPRNELMVNIPTDYPTLQAAVDHLYPVARLYKKIILRINSGHQVTHGLFVEGGDYRRFIIASAGSMVTRAPNFQGAGAGMDIEEAGSHLIAGVDANLPRLATLFDMQDYPGSGYTLITGEGSGYVEPDCGVINAGHNGLAFRGGSCDAHRSIWNGAGWSGIRVAYEGKIAAQSAQCNGCCRTWSGPERGAVDVSRHSRIHFRLGQASDSNRVGINVRRNSSAVFENATIDRSGYQGIRILHNSSFSGFGVLIRNTRAIVPTSGLGRGIWMSGAEGQVNGGTVTGSAQADVNFEGGSVLRALNLTTSGGNPSASDFNGTITFNQISGNRGICYA
jgi:hypothetical protein